MSPAELSAALDELAARYAAPPHQEEAAGARQQFDGQRGRIFDDDQLHELHLNLFLEWYLLERPLAGGLPPVVLHLQRANTAPGASSPGPNQLACWRALAFSARSLFEVVAHLPQGLRLVDLLADALWEVDQQPPLAGVDVGEIFEGRLVPWQGRVLLGPALCFHPREARASIHQLLRQAEEQGTLGPQLTGSLAQMRLRYDRFRNIAVERIYTLGLGG